MCGIFCVVTKEGQPVDIQLINKIAARSRVRGEHATGYFLWKNKNEFALIKETGYDLHLDPDDPDYAGVKFIMGHVRKASQGCFFDNGANHPHMIGDWVMVHNGTSSDLLKLSKALNIPNPTDNDSYAILSLIVRGIEKEQLLPPEAIAQVMSQSAYNDGFSILLFHAKTGYLYAFRNSSRPMVVSPTEDALIFASEDSFIDKSLGGKTLFGLNVSSKCLVVTTDSVCRINVSNNNPLDPKQGFHTVCDIKKNTVKPNWLDDRQKTTSSDQKFWNQPK